MLAATVHCGVRDRIAQMDRGIRLSHDSQPGGIWI
jgi:hypothetical protein